MTLSCAVHDWHILLALLQFLKHRGCGSSIVRGVEKKISSNLVDFMDFIILFYGFLYGNVLHGNLWFVLRILWIF